MAESNKQTPTSSPPSKRIVPGPNAFAQRLARTPRAVTPASVQGRPFLTSPHLYAQSPSVSRSVSDTNQSLAMRQTFQSDPAALWQQIAEQKKYLDEQLARSSAEEDFMDESDLTLNQTGYSESSQAHYERPNTPEGKLNLLASPDPNATPTHRMNLEKVREERLLDLIRSGGSTSPNTRIANIHGSQGASSAKPDLNKPVPPEPGSPKKRFFEKFGLGLGGTPPLKPAEPVKGTYTDPVKQRSSPSKTNLTAKAAKVLGTALQGASKKSTAEKEGAATGHEKGNASTTLTPDWPLAAPKTIPSAQFFCNDFPLTPSPAEHNGPGSSTAAQPALADAIQPEAPMSLRQADGGGVLLKPGPEHAYTRVSPALSGPHSMMGVVEHAAGNASHQAPVSHTMGTEPALATTVQNPRPGSSMVPTPSLTNYDGYSPSIYYGSNHSWYPPPGHPYAPASLYPTPLNVSQHYAYQAGYPAGHRQGSPMSHSAHDDRTPTAIHPPHTANNFSPDVAAASLPDELAQLLEPRFKQIEDAVADLKLHTDTQFKALENKISENHAKYMKAAARWNAKQEQVAAITSSLVEVMEHSMVQSTPSPRSYARHTTHTRPKYMATRSKTRSRSGNASESSPTARSPLAETLPQTAYSPASARARRVTPTRDVTERGPHEQAYFRNLGMPAEHGSREKDFLENGDLVHIPVRKAWSI